MRTIVAGSRTCTDPSIVERNLDELHWDISVLIEGECEGPDLFSKEWAIKRNVPFEEHPACWRTEGGGAGYKRNERMSDVAEALVAFWDGKSKGTKHMIDIANQQGLTVLIVKV